MIGDPIAGVGEPAAPAPPVSPMVAPLEPAPMLGRGLQGNCIRATRRRSSFDPCPARSRRTHAGGSGPTQLDACGIPVMVPALRPRKVEEQTAQELEDCYFSDDENPVANKNRKVSIILSNS